MATACTQRWKDAKREVPDGEGVTRLPQPDAREGQAGLSGMADGFVVSVKPGIAGAAALIAGADEEMISKMREFGRAWGHITQIVNDTFPEDILKDIKKVLRIAR